MTNPTLPNADELEVVATAWKFYGKQCVDLKFAPDAWHVEHGHLTEIEPLVTLSSAQAQLREMALQALADEGQAREALARAEAAEAEAKRLREALEKVEAEACKGLDAGETREALIDIKFSSRSALSGGTSNG